MKNSVITAALKQSRCLDLFRPPLLRSRFTSVVVSEADSQHCVVHNAAHNSVVSKQRLTPNGEFHTLLSSTVTFFFFYPNRSVFQVVCGSQTWHFVLFLLKWCECEHSAVETDVRTAVIINLWQGFEIQPQTRPEQMKPEATSWSFSNNNNPLKWNHSDVLTSCH